MAAGGWNQCLMELLLIAAEKHNAAENDNAFEEILVDPEFSDLAKFGRKRLRYYWHASQLLRADAEMKAKGWNERLIELLLKAAEKHKVAEKHNAAEQHKAFEEILLDAEIESPNFAELGFDSEDLKTQVESIAAFEI